MVLNKFLGIIALSGLLFFSGCSDNDEPNPVPDNTITQAFYKQFPKATDVTWSDKNGYKVASFRLPDSSASAEKNVAWYENNGTCALSEIEIDNFDLLPGVIQEAYTTIGFSADGWTIDDIDYITQPDRSSVYKIEVEKNGQPDYDIIISETGVVLSIRPDADDNDDNQPLAVPSVIKDYIAAEYPGAQLLDLDKENDIWEAALLVKNVEVDLYFDKDLHFMRSETEITEAELPTAIQEAILADYPGWETDDVLFIQQADGVTYYKIELENEATNEEIIVLFNTDGTILE